MLSSPTTAPSVLEQALRGVEADEARRAGDENRIFHERADVSFRCRTGSQAPELDAARLGLAVELRPDVEHEPFAVL